jgi:hypothetical protein
MLLILLLTNIRFEVSKISRLRNYKTWLLLILKTWNWPQLQLNLNTLITINTVDFKYINNNILLGLSNIKSVVSILICASIVLDIVRQTHCNIVIKKSCTELVLLRLLMLLC